jgi:hypothetical protein
MRRLGNVSAPFLPCRLVRNSVNTYGFEGFPPSQSGPTEYNGALAKLHPVNLTLLTFTPLRYSLSLKWGPASRPLLAALHHAVPKAKQWLRS